MRRSQPSYACEKASRDTKRSLLVLESAGESVGNAPPDVELRSKQHRCVVRWFLDDEETLVTHHSRYSDWVGHGACTRLCRELQFLCWLRVTLPKKSGKQTPPQPEKHHQEESWGIGIGGCPRCFRGRGRYTTVVSDGGCRTYPASRCRCLWLY